MADILFIGNIQWGQNSTGGGVQTKNQHFLRYIKSRGVQCKFYDTWGKHSIVSLLMSIFYIIMAKRDEPIILSISARGPYYMANICQLLHLKRRVFYWVAGGCTQRDPPCPRAPTALCPCPGRGSRAW